MTDTQPPPAEVQVPEPPDLAALDRPAAADAIDQMDTTPPIDEGAPPDEDDTPPAEGF